MVLLRMYKQVREGSEPERTMTSTNYTKFMAKLAQSTMSAPRSVMFRPHNLEAMGERENRRLASVGGYLRKP